ncbi:hypothetical protein LTR53_006231 [Teratosphaeriaceae sp. CCFEE 6253]|nr:hypothetical protein LTR53_006231 [Teratosphaeriaceae sp. CCFEE 6253]
MKRAAAPGLHIKAPPRKKHHGSTAVLDKSMQLVHVRANGQKVYPGDMFTEDDEHMRSQQQRDAKASIETQTSGTSPDEEDSESVYEDAQEFDYLDRGEDDDDLFAKTFRDDEAAGEGDADDTDREIPNASHPPKSSKAQSKQRVIDLTQHDPTEHAAGCRSKRWASTPPPPPPHSAVRKPPPPPPRGLHDIDPIKDLRRSLVQQRKLHDRAKQFKPRIPLAAHRYWICVLHPGKKVRTISAEKHFTWMRGNRVTTVQTIWHTYHTTNLTDDFVLLLGHERVEMGDVCGELDYFNDKFVCLRAVEKSSKEARGKALAEGCPPEIIEIDLD